MFSFKKFIIILVVGFAKINGAIFNESSEMGEYGGDSSSTVEISSLEEEDSSEEDSLENPMKFRDYNNNWHVIYLNQSIEFREENDEEVNEQMLSKTRKHVFPRLYLRDKPDNYHILTLENSRYAPTNVSNPTKVIIHGWLTPDNMNWIIKMKDRYFINGNYNVILLDWQHYALRDYLYSVHKTRSVGIYFGKILTQLIAARRINVEDIHIVGHSLGAHISGIAGKTVLEQTGRKIGRITALDAARPLFERPFLRSNKKRLTKNDASFVDAIHTDGGFLGYKHALGHADFFPNRGKGIQPGCDIIVGDVCSHWRSCSFYIESINTNQFLAASCDSWKSFKKGLCDGNERVSMGLNLDLSKANGNYYLRTGRKSPYARG